MCRSCDSDVGLRRAIPGSSAAGGCPVPGAAYRALNTHNSRRLHSEYGGFIFDTRERLVHGTDTRYW